ncbi:guanine nucleotide-binding protein alpha subunit [Spathaspora passalidarum NRRL Y-27907]|uniref:Guanine nucleotide-binding protein alpha subunit n=1 Tax=Spathaspora passalidarum (strain NRRL Y-27907 / 11-Y1) TaxID=619300 RepID=G3AST3_SPAPN|nr:guanine nucleotide-binding protein alpha subunit [Spathaspora passalidarum NRRL Y-27907]EGW31147.1 guanine nucleotide-binding protein alpha subunit [Spathaspora passalidarum NRRL Y-27907]
MGCGASVIEIENINDDPYYQDKLINDKINHQLNLAKTNPKSTIKLLLLGAGESGKSTVVKQMRLLHKGGFTQQERRQYANIIWSDIIQSMKTLIIQARKLRISLDCDVQGSPLISSKQIVLRSEGLEQIDTSAAGGTTFINDYLLKYSEQKKSKRRMRSTGVTKGASFWDADAQDDEEQDGIEEEDLVEYYQVRQSKQSYTRKEIAEAIHNLWKKDSGIRRCFERCNEFQFESSAGYYFDNVFNFADPNYLCNDTDILKGRIKTTGISENNFTINNHQFKVYDAGGQRSERKKWIHCFEGITAVLFVLAISEYDQMLFEDERVNRMHESIVLFDSICNSKWFYNTPCILFLNKIDIFEKKIKRNPLKKYFPDYSGDPSDFEEAMKFFETNFLLMNRTNKPIYIHRTCATDTTSMKFVLSAVTDMIVQQNLKKSGVM